MSILQLMMLGKFASTDATLLNIAISSLVFRGMDDSYAYWMVQIMFMLEQLE